MHELLPKFKGYAGSCGFLREAPTMLAGDREHVRKTRDVHRLVHRRRNSIALARDHRGGDRPVVARQDRTDPLVDRLAHGIDRHRITQPPRQRLWRRGSADMAEHEAGRADAVEIHVAMESGWLAKLTRFGGHFSKESFSSVRCVRKKSANGRSYRSHLLTRGMRPLAVYLRLPQSSSGLTLHCRRLRVLSS